MVENEEDSEIRVFPNPSGNTVHINSNLKIAAIWLYNSYGMLLNTKLKNTETELDISDLPDGLYLIRIENEGKKHISEVPLIKMSND